MSSNTAYVMILQFKWTNGEQTERKCLIEISGHSQTAQTTNLAQFACLVNTRRHRTGLGLHIFSFIDWRRELESNQLQHLPLKKGKGQNVAAERICIWFPWSSWKPMVKPFPFQIIWQGNIKLSGKKSSNEITLSVGLAKNTDIESSDVTTLASGKKSCGRD